MYPKFIEVVKYNENGIWIFIRLKSLIKGSLQVVFDKNDGEKSQFAIWKEVRKEISLKLFQMQYLIIDEDYDCDIYIYDIKRFKLRYMKPLKADLWKYYL